MEYCTDGHPSEQDDTCLHGHPVVKTGVPSEMVSTDAEPTSDPGEALHAKSLEIWKEWLRVEAEQTNEYKGDHMGDNISTPTIQGPGFSGFGGWGGVSHWKSDGLEGKDASFLGTLHTADGQRDLLARILESKCDILGRVDDKMDRVRDRFEDKFDKLDCKLERIEDRVQEFERRRVDRVVKEQDDKIHELKFKLYMCEHPPVPAPVPAP